MQGQLGEKLVPDLIREIAHKNSSGLLRLSRGKAIKAIFFESGAPTFAISNLTNEQLDHKLVEFAATARMGDPRRGQGFRRVSLQVHSMESDRKWEMGESLAR